MFPNREHKDTFLRLLALPPKCIATFESSGKYVSWLNWARKDRQQKIPKQLLTVELIPERRVGKVKIFLCKLVDTFKLIVMIVCLLCEGHCFPTLTNHKRPCSMLTLCCVMIPYQWQRVMGLGIPSHMRLQFQETKS